MKDLSTAFPGLAREGPLDALLGSRGTERLRGLLPQGAPTTVASGTSCEAEGDAPSDLPNGTALPFPVSCTGGFGETDDGDAFTVTLAPGEWADAVLAAEADYGLCLFDPDGGTWDCVYDFDPAPQHVRFGGVAGTWSLLVDRFGDVAGTYALDVQPFLTGQDDCGLGFDASGSWRLPSPVTSAEDCVGRHAAPDTLDWYAVDLPAHAYVEFVATPDPLADVDTCAVTPDGVTFACGLTTAPGFAETVRFATEEDAGAWRLGLGGGSPAADYRLEARLVPGPPPQDDCASGRDASWRYERPTVVDVSATCAGSFDAFDWLDWYAIDLPHDESYFDAVVTPPPGVHVACTVTPDLFLFECGEVDDGSPLRVRGGGTGGRWLVAVLDVFSSGGAYGLDLGPLSYPAQDDCGSGADASENRTLAVPLGYPVACEATMHEIDVLDWFATSAPEGWVEVALAPSAGLDADVCVVAPGEVRCGARDGLGEPERFIVPPGQAGAWEVVVLLWRGSGTYALSVADAPPPPAQDDCGLGRDATQDDTDIVGVPTTCAGMLETLYGDARDSFAFTPPPGRDLRFRSDADGAETCIRHQEALACGDDVVLRHLEGPASVRVSSVANAATPYAFTLETSEAQVARGSILLGTPVAVDGARGPEGASGVDGAWVALDEVSDGVAYTMLRLTSLTAGEIVFHDADLAPLGTCADAGQRECSAPAGSAWALVHLTLGAASDYRLEYRYFP